MAVGDDAKAAGYPVVAGSDKVVDGDLEINRTRDLVAQVNAKIPVGKAAYRLAAGITAGYDDPVGGIDGDIYLKILPS